MKGLTVSLLWGLAAFAAPVAAQPSDPIADVLQRQARQDPEEPDEAAERPMPQPEPVIVQPPRTAPPSPPPPPTIKEPVFVGQTGRTPDRPPSVADLAYESRIRASSASAQGFQGPLDGGWTLAAAEGELYAFQLSDKGAGVVEGAWRDLRKAGALNASGFVDQIERVGGEVTLRFGPAVATLQGTADGRWTGELAEGGRARAVTLRRRP
jgi:hypothetical protein